MKCPRCESESREGVKYCEDCGTRLDFTCPRCEAKLSAGKKFCGECGFDLKSVSTSSSVPADTVSHPPLPVAESESISIAPAIGERKHVTALFSDLSGYTLLSEKLDPEEIKEIMGRIFSRISEVITKYEGFIEKNVGDAVLALFGVITSHEDDPLRAIRAASEIHRQIASMGTGYKEKFGQPLLMHTGINTDLVITGEVDQEKGTHSVIGDAINIAARISALAKPDEILVSKNTYNRAEGYFNFQKLQPAKIKGKSTPVQVYKFLADKETPSKIHRLSGLRADLIGRNAESAQLQSALQRLKRGEGSVLAICGEAGTGKSRLIEEFKANIDSEEIQWIEGYAYSYNQNIPYYLFIDLFNRAWKIEEGDNPDLVKTKIETHCRRLSRNIEELIPYIGSLYSLKYPEIDGVNPEIWKLRLHDAMQRTIEAFSKQAHTIMCLEDIHWADPSSIDLFRFLIMTVSKPMLFIYVYRPPFSLFAKEQEENIGNRYRSIQLKDLSKLEAEDMIESLLGSRTIPHELRQFISKKVEGNPFYLEEVINTLIDSGALVRGDGRWRITRSISDSDAPPTVQGIISARLDRLDNKSKRVLQEAAVIGRVFLYVILKQITKLEINIDQYLHRLEQTGIIHRKYLTPDLEYVFKHALTHEVVYRGLLRKNRQVIHERIAHVIETLFKERLSEFYEALAFHYEHSNSLSKSVHYLLKSGEKSLRKYSVEESHQYFNKAFNLLLAKSDKTREDIHQLIDLLFQWSWVFHYRGDFRGLKQLLLSHKQLVEELNDQTRLGMYHALYGLALYETGQVKEANESLHQALRYGELTEDKRVIGYSSSWLAWSCTELGRMDEAIHYGQKALAISQQLVSDEYIFFGSLSGMGLAYWYKGDRKNTFDTGKNLLEYGQQHTSIRSLVLGHFIMGCSYLIGGDFTTAIECFNRSIEVSADPWYSQFPRMLLGLSYLSCDKLSEAEDALQQVIDYSEKFDTELIKSPANTLMGVISIAKGELSQGLKMLKTAQKEYLKSKRKYAYATSEDILGKIYLKIVEGAPVSLAIIKNFGFLLKNVPFASRKAEQHFNKSILVAKEIGAKSMLGIAYLDLAQVHRQKGRKDRARGSVLKAIEVLEQCDAEFFLKQARELLASLS